MKKIRINKEFEEIGRAAGMNLMMASAVRQLEPPRKAVGDYLVFVHDSMVRDIETALWFGAGGRPGAHGRAGSVRSRKARLMAAWHPKRFPRFEIVEEACNAVNLTNL